MAIIRISAPNHIHPVAQTRANNSADVQQLAIVCGHHRGAYLGDLGNMRARSGTGPARDADPRKMPADHLNPTSYPEIGFFEYWGLCEAAQFLHFDRFSQLEADAKIAIARHQAGIRA